MDNVKIKLTEQDRKALVYALNQYLQSQKLSKVMDQYIAIMIAYSYRELICKLSSPIFTGKPKTYTISLPQASALVLMTDDSITHTFSQYTSLLIYSIIMTIDKTIKSISNDKNWKALNEAQDG